MSRLTNELSELGLWGFARQKIRKHNRAWWKWRVYTATTILKMLFIRHKMHRIVWFGPWARMSRWACPHRKKSFCMDDIITVDFNSIKPKTVLWNRVCLEKDLFDQPIIYLEFGVYKGASLMWWADHNQKTLSKFWGFDSFDGLPEKFAGFGHGFLKEADPPVNVSGRVHFVKGLFQKTLNGFFDTYVIPDYPMVCHLDADAYSGTMYALMQIERVLCPGDVLIFDEFAHADHEFKAFTDFIRATGRDFRMIGATDVFYHVAFEVLS